MRHIYNQINFCGCLCIKLSTEHSTTCDSRTNLNHTIRLHTDHVVYESQLFIIICIIPKHSSFIYLDDVQAVGYIKNENAGCTVITAHGDPLSYYTNLYEMTIYEGAIQYHKANCSDNVIVYGSLKD